MLSFSSSNLLSKFKIVQQLHYQGESETIEEPALLSEMDGSENFSVNFLICPKEPAENRNRKSGGSCFSLLKRLVQSSNTSMALTKDTLVTILSRNNQLLDELKQSEEFQSNNYFIGEEKELIISVDGESCSFRIPTHDFAVVRQGEYLFICTALEKEMGNERVFLTIRNFSDNLETLLRGFMAPPETEISSQNSFSLPILPSIDTNSLFIQPANHFESFMDVSQQDCEESQSFHYSQPTETTKSQVKSVNTSPSRPQKRSDSAVKTANSGNRQCLNCFCTSTPMWRRGPDGTASLCNACGVKFKSGKLQMDPELVESNLKKIRLYQQQQQQQPASLILTDELTAQIAQSEQTLQIEALPQEEIVLHQY